MHFTETVPSHRPQDKQVASGPGKPTVIGLYGISGCGKTFLLKKLAQCLGKEEFEFYEGSEKIDTLVPGGLSAFGGLSEDRKSYYRCRAIQEIARDALLKKRTAVVAGHYMFPNDSPTNLTSVWTASDAEIFTHIIYLAVPIEIVASRRLSDQTKARPSISSDDLLHWQDTEIKELRSICCNEGILFSNVTEQSDILSRVSNILRYFQSYTTESNLAVANEQVARTLSHRNDLQTVVVLDADKTLAPADTGTDFWEISTAARHCADGSQSLKALFSSPFGYSETAFREAVLLYEDAAGGEEYEAICAKVASSVKLYPEMMTLLQSVTQVSHVGVIVVTCGLKRVWELVFEREEFGGKVGVIGAGRLSDGLVVTPSVKAAIVSKLRATEGLYVFAFGDSPLDLPMLMEANEAVVVVGNEQHRSRSMDAALSKAIDGGWRGARQVLLPSSVQPRLDKVKLPQLDITDKSFLQSIMRSRRGDTGTNAQVVEEAVASHLRILHATDRSAAKLLMTPMRDASVCGPGLRQVHHDVGRYLAMEFLSDMIGLEEVAIPHVQGHNTTGFRIFHEQKTSIIALMRGGGPMALGVNEVLPEAAFVHASKAQDVKHPDLESKDSVILVDSVINTGKSIIEFVQHITQLRDGIRIVVVAGVVQAEVVSEGHPFASIMAAHDVGLVALRFSENKFTGTKGTDTGNRLFNTTHLA